MQISDQIIEVLDYLCEKLGITVDWTSANVLPYLTTLCEKYVRYEIATSIVWIVVSILWAFSSCYFLKKSVTALKKNPYGTEAECWSVAAFLCLGCIIATTVIIVYQTMDIVKCCTIPEKVIFDYIQTVIATK